MFRFMDLNRASVTELGVYERLNLRKVLADGAPLRGVGFLITMSLFQVTTSGEGLITREKV